MTTVKLLFYNSGGWPLVMAGLAEVGMVSYIYGIRRFYKDISLMLGAPPNAFWKFLGMLLLI